MTTREVRNLTGTIETRRAPAGDSATTRKIGGYAATFGTVTTICGMFQEVLAPGCFDASLTRGDDIRALFNHDWNYVLGRRSAGTLELAEDAKGLTFEATPPETTWANDLAISVERQDVRECSFCFQATKQEWDETGELPRRTVIQADLFEVSVVANPAYDGTSASMRMFQSRSQELDLQAGAVLAGRRLRMRHAQHEAGVR